MIKIGKYEIDRQDISVGLMILFALVIMFFLGYRYAYGVAITDANNQIVDIIEEYKTSAGVINQNKPIDINNFILNVGDMNGSKN